MKLNYATVNRNLVPSTSKVEQGSSKVEPARLDFAEVGRRRIPTTTKLVDMNKVETVEQPRNYLRLVTR